MIRNAENFLYIENQYFLGSAYAWLSDVETNADHTIPAEIAQKVKRKEQPSISSMFYVRIFRTKASFCCQNFVRKLYFGLNFLAPKFRIKICVKVRDVARLIYEKTSRVIGLNVVYLLMFNGHDTTHVRARKRGREKERERESVCA